MVLVVMEFLDFLHYLRQNTHSMWEAGSDIVLRWNLTRENSAVVGPLEKASPGPGI